MNLDKFTGPGSTPSRRRFWDKARDVVISLQKLEGNNVSVDERQGAGTVINVPFDNRGRPSSTNGACCGVAGNDYGTPEDCTEACALDHEGGICVESICYFFNSYTDCSVIPESICADIGGDWQGVGTACDPNPCEGPPATGACCITTDLGGPTGAYCGCLGCQNDTHDKLVTCMVETAHECFLDGGVYHGDDTTCPVGGCVQGIFHEGEVCDDVCPLGTCCTYFDGVLSNHCFGTTESQCNSACCDDPNCDRFDFIWNPVLCTTPPGSTPPCEP